MRQELLYSFDILLRSVAIVILSFGQFSVGAIVESFVDFGAAVVVDLGIF